MPSSIPQGIALLSRAAWAAAELALLMAVVLGWIWVAHSVAQRQFVVRRRDVSEPDTGHLARLLNVPEYYIYVAIIVTMTATYLYAGFLSTSHWFGFSHVRHMGLPLTVASLAVVTIMAVRLGPTLETSDVMAGLSRRLASPRWCILLAVVFVVVAFPLRTTVINADGLMWRDYFTSRTGPVLSVDELLELYVHYLFITTVGRALGITIVSSYQILSVLAGGAFVYVLARLCAKLLAESSGWLFLWVLTGGFMQLFFGEVENYSLVTVIMIVYLWAGVLHLSGRVSLIVPSVLLALAAAFHLLAIFLGPSWLYLCALDLRRRGWRGVVISCAAGAALLLSTLLFVHFVVYGHRSLKATVDGLTEISHGLDANIWLRLVRRSLVYHIELGNLLFLLVPQALIVLPLVVYRRIERTDINVFIGWSAASSILMLLLWPAGLGVSHDWNVFAPMSIALAIWCAYNFLRVQSLPYKVAIALGLTALGAAHSYSWIICNHLLSCS